MEIDVQIINFKKKKKKSAFILSLPLAVLGIIPLLYLIPYFLYIDVRQQELEIHHLEETKSTDKDIKELRDKFNNRRTLSIYMFLIISFIIVSFFITLITVIVTGGNLSVPQ